MNSLPSIIKVLAEKIKGFCKLRKFFRVLLIVSSISLEIAENLLEAQMGKSLGRYRLGLDYCSQWFMINDLNTYWSIYTVGKIRRLGRSKKISRHAPKSSD